MACTGWYLEPSDALRTGLYRPTRKKHHKSYHSKHLPLNRFIHHSYVLVDQFHFCSFCSYLQYNSNESDSFIFHFTKAPFLPVEL